MINKKSVAVIGYGLIGSTICEFLTGSVNDTMFNVVPYDIRHLDGVHQINGTDEDFDQIAARHDAIVVATPHSSNMAIATACAKHNCAYFDMTEDVFVTEHAKELAKSGGWFMPQCGLAPGVVSIIAKHLVDNLGAVDDRRVEIRVGALPRAANNHMKYYLTWSSDGLVNEYCNPCHAVVDGKAVNLQPLEGTERLTIDGVEYEAFNTSGGLGTLRETMDGVVANLNYKTIRYPGHRDYFHFLLSELGMSKRKPLLVDILNQQVPHITDDVVVIYITVSGREKTERGWVLQDSYCHKVFSKENMSAIQLTTAAGLCVAVDWWAVHNSEEAVGFKRSENIPWEFFRQSVFSQPYLK
jgi:saccharopine dehydrogenase-like NADP-dependent oxidoreductase